MVLLAKLAIPALIGTLSLVLLSARPHVPEVRLAVAANFLGPVETLVDGFERATGHRVRTSSGSTGKLYAQIVSGAPYDVFLAANEQEPRRLERQGYAVGGTRFTYARGVLVLWLPEGATASDARTAFRAVEHRSVAIANPLVAPYGAAAEAVLERWGELDHVARRVVRGESIAQAYQFAASGNAAAGFVALSQVRSSSGPPSGRYWAIDDALYPPIRQQAVLLERGADNRAAREFLRYLRSRDAREAISSAGYELE